MNTTWTCRTADTVSVFSWDGHDLILEELNHCGINRCIPSKIPFPKQYRIGDEGDPVPFEWELCREYSSKDGFDIMFVDEKSDCSYKVSLKGRPDIAGPVEYSAVLRNSSPEIVRIWVDEIFSAIYSFEKPATAWRIAKEHWLAEGIQSKIRNKFAPGPGIYKDLITEGMRVTAETNTNQDFNCAGMIPMIYLDSGECGAYIAFEWINSNINAEYVSGGVRVSVELHEGFTTRVRPGYDFTVAPIYIGVYTGDVDDGSNIFKRWFFLEKSPKNVRENTKEPLAQQDDYGWEPEKVKELGYDSVKWDYGWWETEDKIVAEGLWRFNGGSWKLRSKAHTGLVERRNCKTMKEFGALMRDHDINWTVYLLLHDAVCELEGDDQLTTHGPTAHPEWFSNRCVIYELLADLGNEECVTYLKRKLHEFFVNNNVRTWRSDFEPIVCFSDKDNLHDANGNDVQYWCARSFYEILDGLIEDIPGFRYESCSSSGSMKDFATFRRCSVMNNDDSADISSLRVTFYDASYCFPPAQLQSPCGDSSFYPERSSYPFITPEMGFSAMIMGAVMLDSGDEERLKDYLSLHNNIIKPLIRDANLYHIFPRPDMIHWDGMQYGCDFIPDSGVCGAAFLFKPTNEEGATKHIPVRGLNPDYLYSVEFKQRPEQNFTTSGRELMENGYDFTIEEESGNDIALYVFKGYKEA